MCAKPIIEDVDSEELSSSDIQPYLPSKNMEELEPDEKVYAILEYISLDWPSQTITNRNDKFYAATNPDNDKANIIELDFYNSKNYTEFKSVNLNKFEVDQSYNRIRINNEHLFCLSDNTFDVYSTNKMKRVHTLSDDYGYGIALEEKIALGHKNGKITIYDYNFNIIHDIKHHTNSVESIVISENIIYSASCDKTSKGIDLRSNQIVFEHNDNCDINAIDYFDNKILLGLDNGNIVHIDKRNNAKENIKWHSTPISFVKWKTSNEFVSCSDEQVAIWDSTYEEEWEFHKYLRFVHQGQKFYKEVVIVDDIYAVTSVDGLCFFKLALQ